MQTYYLAAIAVMSRDCVNGNALIAPREMRKHFTRHEISLPATADIMTPFSKRAIFTIILCQTRKEYSDDCEEKVSVCLCVNVEVAIVSVGMLCVIKHK